MMNMGKLLGVISGLAVVSTLTYGYTGFDHSVAQKAGRDQRHLAGCSSWCNAYTCNMAPCTDCASCSAPSCSPWCNRYTCHLSYCSGCGINQGCYPAGVDRCDPWCNSYTCASSACTGCQPCKNVAAGSSCANWCSDQTCNLPNCNGCATCAVGGHYDLNPTISRVPPAADEADLSGKAVMMWDRLQVEEKTNIYGRLLDNFGQHCEVDGYCFGDLFINGGWICEVDFFDVAFPHPEFDLIYPGAAPLSSGKTIGGPACKIGGESPNRITNAYRPTYGNGGTFQSNGHQPRHTINNFVVTQQDANTMTTQHYLIIERYFHFEGSDNWVGYDGSGYTVQVKWTKEGSGYTGLWKMTQMAQVHQGDGHMGLPPDSTLTQYQEFINAQRAVGGLAPYQARRELSSDWKPPSRKLQSTSRYGDIDPLKTHIPNPTSNSMAVQMAWDRQEMLERISMYSWLADETRTNILEGHAWGELYAEGGMWCAYTTGATFDFPNFDNYEQGYTFDGHSVGGGPCGAGAPTGCESSCTPFMGGYTANIMQTMITATFGNPSAATARYQQTRHTLTNKIFLDQSLMTAKTWVYNTLERFIKGVAYDNSFFMYQHEWIKQQGVWKWAKIAAYTQGHGHLGGLPPLTDWDPWVAGVNNYPDNSGVASRATPAGRQLAGVEEPKRKLQTSPQSQGYSSTLKATYNVHTISSGSIPAHCPYNLASLGSLVPDDCCSTATTKFSSGDFTDNSCLSFPFPVDNSLWVRVYLGCDGGIPTFGEVCTPPGTATGQGYPFGGSAQNNNGDLIECRCSDDFQLTPSVQAIHYGTGCHAGVTPYMLGGDKVDETNNPGSDSAFFVSIEGECIPPGATTPGPSVATHAPIGPITTTAPNIQLNPRVNRVPIAATAALASGDVETAMTMMWDRLEITERLNMYPWLADENRRNVPKGFHWGDLYGDNVYFCQFNFFNVSAHRPTWDELVPGLPGAFGIPLHNSAPGTGVATSCEPGGIPAPYAAGGMQTLTNGFGLNGVFQTRNQQTRHTFSNFAYLMQTVDSAATLNYNIVERYVDGIAMDGSNFLYHMDWSKIGGRWYSMKVKVIHFGDDRLGAVPTPAEFTTWLNFIRSAAFI